MIFVMSQISLFQATQLQAADTRAGSQVSGNTAARRAPLCVKPAARTHLSRRASTQRSVRLSTRRLKTYALVELCPAAQCHSHRSSDRHSEDIGTLSVDAQHFIDVPTHAPMWDLKRQCPGTPTAKTLGASANGLMANRSY